ncbi:ATP-binding protein [Burkholderia stabilis]|uniref:ATP-binding protein n=1 Tax=Burkholderia stabilis TaxID=95485 RepID=A0A4Q2ABY8_9BURK|nr:AAA family ATPase [Burkholderia stabilis]RXV67122.1 ATP-binding protein [Burkholderia stabilis]
MRFFFSERFDFDALDGFHLLQDHVGTHYSKPWNDHNYIVTFRVYRVSNGIRQSFGSVKVLVKDFQDTSKYFLQGTKDGGSYNITSLLKPTNVVSLASDIDYYQRLHKALGKTEANRYLQRICDASYNHDRFSDYSTWPGFSSSLFRNGSAAQAILDMGRQIALGRHEREKTFSITLNDLPDTFDPLTFNFSNDDNDRLLGVSNINLLIGKNGVGKSHILRHIVDLVAGVQPISESWPYFYKAVVTGYSPFENFDTKKALLNRLRARDATQDSPASEPDDSDGRAQLDINEYAYIGFKNDENEFSLSWPKSHSARSILKILQYDRKNLWWTNESRFVTLFDTLKLSIDFDTLELTKHDGTRITLARDDDPARKEIDTLETTIDVEQGFSFVKGERILELSSGQRMYSYMLPCLAAEVEDESLLIIDEPELYLHPTMEVNLINMLKHLLVATKSYAIIATHSSVMAREIKRDAVTILRREHGRTRAYSPNFETFGESIDKIIGEAFDEYHVRKPYEKTLDRAIENYGSIEQALDAIAPQVGNEALAYVAAKFARDTGIDIEVRE